MCKVRKHQSLYEKLPPAHLVAGVFSNRPGQKQFNLRFRPVLTERPGLLSWQRMLHVAPLEPLQRMLYLIGSPPSCLPAHFLPPFRWGNPTAREYWTKPNSLLLFPRLRPTVTPSPRCSMVVSPDRALCLPTFCHSLWTVNKSSSAAAAAEAANPDLLSEPSVERGVCVHPCLCLCLCPCLCLCLCLCIRCRCTCIRICIMLPQLQQAPATQQLIDDHHQCLLIQPCHMRRSAQPRVEPACKYQRILLLLAKTFKSGRHVPRCCICR